MQLSCYLVFFTLLAVTAHAQRVYEARVVDKETGKPIPFASVGIVGTAKGTSTNLDGWFSLAVENKVPIKITCIGYESVQLSSLEFIEEIQLSPEAVQLKDVVVFSKGVHPEKIVRKAIQRVSDNFPSQSFFQSFFYRHYCQDDDRYGRLIEAYVDVWRHQGYRDFRSAAGQREELRVVQMRRSLDRTTIAQSHTPHSVDNILMADMAAYQSSETGQPFDFYAGLNNLRTDILQYDFTFGGITSLDGSEVFEIKFQYPKTLPADAPKYPAGLRGSMYITTEKMAIVKFEETRYKGNDTIRSSAFYQQQGSYYYPYRLIRDGGTYRDGKKVHWFHVEMSSTEISLDPARRFASKLPDSNELLALQYDSAYWQQHSALAATPLEQKIINDLGGGRSLTQQFSRYRLYHLNTQAGDVNGADKLKWLTQFFSDQNPFVVAFWQGDYQQAMAEIERFKLLNKHFNGRVAFAMVCVDGSSNQWRETIAKHHLAQDGLIQLHAPNAIGTNGQAIVYRLAEKNDAWLALPPDANGLQQAIEKALENFEQRGNKVN
jgi:hypothetical protein